MAPELPIEILLQIFTLLRDSLGYSGVHPSLVVSRTWSKAAHTVLWSHVVLGSDSSGATLARFIERYSTIRDNDMLRRITSLTVDIRPPVGLFWNLLGRLAAIIRKSITDLKSFSLILSTGLKKPTREARASGMCSPDSRSYYFSEHCRHRAAVWSSTPTAGSSSTMTDLKRNIFASPYKSWFPDCSTSTSASEVYAAAY